MEKRVVHQHTKFLNNVWFLAFILFRRIFKQNILGNQKTKNIFLFQKGGVKLHRIVQQQQQKKTSKL